MIAFAISGSANMVNMPMSWAPIMRPTPRPMMKDLLATVPHHSITLVTTSAALFVSPLRHLRENGFMPSFSRADVWCPSTSAVPCSYLFPDAPRAKALRNVGTPFLTPLTCIM